MGATFVVLGLLVILAQHQMRKWEAGVSAAVLDVTRGASHAHAVGTAVIFPINGSWVGFNLTVGCTAALLLTPFFLVAAGLLLARRVSVTRGVASLALVSILVLVVNQLRFLIIAISMHAWGFHTGYERSHVLLGSLVSTFGVAVGVVIFLIALTTERTPLTRRDRP